MGHILRSAMEFERQPAQVMDYGTLFEDQSLIHNFSDVVHGEFPSAGPEELEECLWPYRKISGLNVLFDPLATADCGEIGRSSAGYFESAVRAGKTM
jgi:hypothetical protein